MRRCSRRRSNLRPVLKKRPSWRSWLQRGFSSTLWALEYWNSIGSIWLINTPPSQTHYIHFIILTEHNLELVTHAGNCRIYVCSVSGEWIISIIFNDLLNENNRGVHLQSERAHRQGVQQHGAQRPQRQNRPGSEHKSHRDGQTRRPHQPDASTTRSYSPQGTNPLQTRPTSLRRLRHQE